MILGNVSGIDNQAVVSAWIAQFNTIDADDNLVLPHLAIVRAAAVDAINQWAGNERSKNATNIPFQGDLYQLKEKEALSYQSDNNPNASKYPILYMESSAIGKSTDDLAAEYLGNAKLFPQLLAQIEYKRMGIITKIKAASTIQEIEAALIELG